MFRLGQITKLVGIVTMVGLLLWLPTLEYAVSQQPQVPKREQIKQGLKTLLTKLTASEGDIFDIDNAVFYTDESVTLAYSPIREARKAIRLLVFLFQRKLLTAILTFKYLRGRINHYECEVRDTGVGCCTCNPRSGCGSSCSGVGLNAKRPASALVQYLKRNRRTPHFIIAAGIYLVILFWKKR